MHKQKSRDRGATPGAADCSAQQLGNPYTVIRAANKAPIVGVQFGHWTVVGTDMTCKRITCQCVCGRVHTLGRGSLESGAVSSCGCRPPSLEEREALRDELTHRHGGAS